MIINRLTGKEPNDRELEILRQRAIEIVTSPYSSLEQLEWAIEIYPEAISELIRQRTKPWEKEQP